MLLASTVAIVLSVVAGRVPLSLCFSRGYEDVVTSLLKESVTDSVL